VTPTTELRVYDTNSSRLIPVPIIIEPPGVNHPALTYVKDKGGSLIYPCFDTGGRPFRSVTYKRVRIGKLCYVFDEHDNKALEMDPNRIDISSGNVASSKRLNRTFSLFS